MSITWQPGQTLGDMEKAIICFALRYYENNKTKTASSLGVSVRTIDNKLAKYEGREKKSATSNGANTDAEGTESRDSNQDG